MRRAGLQPASRGNRFWRRGSALVEVAVCFPVFMLILLGIIEFGRAMSVNQMLTASAREGCRAASLDGSSNSEVETLIRDQVSAMVGCNRDVISVSIAITSNATGSAVGSLSNATSRDLIAINVTVPYSSVSFAVSRYAEGKTLRGQCAIRHE